MTELKTGTGNRGTVMVPVLLVVFLIATLTVIVQTTAVSVVERVVTHSEEARLEAAGDAVVDMAGAQVWGAYVTASGGQSGNIYEARAWLDDFGIRTDTTYDAIPALGLPLNESGAPSIDGLHVHEAVIDREDQVGAVGLRVRATVGLGDVASNRNLKTVERVYFITGAEWQGFEFGLLANNVNCIMCHATFDNVERYYNRDAAKYGTFDRVRVGSLETMLIRSTSADSVVAGSIYTRGDFLDKDGSHINDVSKVDIASVVFDTEGKIVEDGDGDLQTVDLEEALGNPMPPLKSFYKDYPDMNETQPDGPLPDHFPPVIPDENQNHVVDDEEFENVRVSSTGTITSGYKVVVDKGDAYGGLALPSGDTAGDISNSVDGHLILRGTEMDPLLINGRVVVNGDVVIQGVVKGTGSILARGNVYIVGPVIYADGTDDQGNRTFGAGEDGNVNKFTIGAGGNILVGDFLSSTVEEDSTVVPDFTSKDSRAISGDQLSDGNFTESEMLLFNRAEWTKTQVELPGKNGKMEANPYYDPDYMPRYYVLDPDDPVYIYNQDQTYYDPDTETWVGKEHVSGFADLNKGVTEYLPGTPEYDDSERMSLMPEGQWLDDTQIINMCAQSAALHENDGTFEMDAVLYTNNSVMFLARKLSAYGGKALINGGLIGADVGVLVAGGLQLNYDQRHKHVIRLKSEQRTVFQRGPRLR